VIAYLDASALVKRYVAERGSRETIDFTARAEVVATSLISRTEVAAARAETLAWDHALRGYDAVQLASALSWQESVGTAITLATFDRQLWEAAQQAGVRAWPDSLPG
jgi:predicted nucleic acid-binding protein